MELNKTIAAEIGEEDRCFYGAFRMQQTACEHPDPIQHTVRLLLSVPTG